MLLGPQEQTFSKSRKEPVCAEALQFMCKEEIFVVSFHMQLVQFS